MSSGLQEPTVPDDLAALADDHPPEIHSEGRSLVDRIRERHANKKRHLDRPIPRWEGDVVARYGPIDKKTLVGLGKRRASATAMNADLLVHACIEILVRDENGDLQAASLADDIDAPIRFDGRLADLFALGGASPRDFVVRMYADTVALGKDAQRILAWQTGEDLDDIDDEEEIDDDLGEEGAAT